MAPFKQSKDWDEKENFENCMKLDGILQLAMVEMLRHISQDCKERGELFFEIWQSYRKNNEELKLLHKGECQQSINRSDAHYNVTHKIYNRKV